MIEPPQRTLGDLLDSLADGQAPDPGLTVAAEDGATSLTYAELADASLRAAAGFARLGVEPGDRVVVLLANRLETVLAWFGLARLGAIFVPANPALTPRELAHVVTTAGASVGVAEGSALAATGLRTVPPDDLLADAPLADVPAVGPEDPVELVYTSGTTSAPKAAVITHANCVFSGAQKAAAMELTADDRVLSALPVFHVNAQSALLAALSAGAPFVLTERYSASRYCEQLAAHGTTVTSLVGTQVRTLLRQEPGAGDRAHATRRAWFALNVSEAERAAFEERFGIRLLNGYGLTEAFTSVTQAPLHGPDCYPAVGAPLPGRALRVDAPDGEVGEILVGGEPGRTIMAGYWNDAEATAATIRDGWLHTGDLGRLDEGGFLHFVERKALTIKRAGENIAAGEVEQVLLEHPDVAEAAVVGVSDAIRDEAVKAVVVLGRGASATVEELEQHCAARLAPFKVPTVWSLRDELPRNSLGKVEYRRLRDEAADEMEAVL